MLAASGQAASAAQATYLSLGDSIAFGETAFSGDPALGPYADPSNGDRGYVGQYADDLGKAGGTRPDVINLAVDGETSASFTAGVGRVPPAPVGFTDASLADLNTHYTGATPPTQAALLASTLAAHGAGNPITHVTISLGSNDLFLLALTDPNPAADLQATLATFRSNYASLLTTLRASLPGATIDLIGTYDPFTATPTSPFAALAGVAIPLLNQEIQSVAGEFGANYVDTFHTTLTTDAARTTLILNQGDVHPAFDPGYRIITGQIEAVPEPSAVVTLGIGLAGVLGYVRRRRRA